MEKCKKCNIPAIQLMNGECIECMLFQRHSDPAPVTYDEKLNAILSTPGIHSFLSVLHRLWTGAVAVRLTDVPHQHNERFPGKEPHYMYFDRGMLMCTSEGRELHVSMLDMQCDHWHVLPFDMEAECPVGTGKERMQVFLNRHDSNERNLFFAHCEHADSWMHQ
jgi:hypothetical protein